MNFLKNHLLKLYRNSSLFAARASKSVDNRFMVKIIKHKPGRGFVEECLEEKTHLYHGKLKKAN